MFALNNVSFSLTYWTISIATAQPSEGTIAFRHKQMRSEETVCLDGPIGEWPPEAGLIHLSSLAPLENPNCPYFTIRASGLWSPLHSLNQTRTRGLISRLISFRPFHPFSLRCQQTQQWPGLNQARCGPFLARNNQRLETTGGGSAFGPLGSQCHCCVEQRGQEQRAPPGGMAGKDPRGRD